MVLLYMYCYVVLLTLVVVVGLVVLVNDLAVLFLPLYIALGSVNVSSNYKI